MLSLRQRAVLLPLTEAAENHVLLTYVIEANIP